MDNLTRMFQALNDSVRPNATDYINRLFPDFLELHGDRLSWDDPSIVGGIATIDSQPVTVIGQIRGHTLQENIKANFSMCHPQGYRKSLRLMKQAEKFHRPIICFVDTLGAYPGLDAEQNGQSAAIANHIQSMVWLKVPILSIIIGNGGSGGALALCIADEMIMLENAMLSVISPKGCANILWKDSSRHLEAAGMLKLTAKDTHKMGLCDHVIKEPTGEQVDSCEAISGELKRYIRSFLHRYRRFHIKKTVLKRVKKYRSYGESSVQPHRTQFHFSKRQP